MRRAGERFLATQRGYPSGSRGSSWYRRSGRTNGLLASGDLVAVVVAERAGRVLGEGVAVPLAVRGAHERRHDLEVPLGHVGSLPPEVGQAEVDVELEEIDASGLLHACSVRAASDGIEFPQMARIRVGLPGIPARDDPRRAVEILLQRGYDACEIDFEGGFWMDYPWAEALGDAACEANVALSVHAPLFGFMGHLEASGRKFSSAVGALDRSAGIAAVCGATVVVFHPGFLLGRPREDAIASVVEQLGMLRDRLEGKGRAVPFGVEVMGRVRDLGSLDDVVEISRATGWVRPVLDFAHMHATSDGAYLEASLFAEALEAVDDVLDPDVPFHIHFSDIAYANRNEKHHLPYGEGTLRADPLREALERFERPATVISEAPDEASSQAIRAILTRA